MIYFFFQIEADKSVGSYDVIENPGRIRLSSDKPGLLFCKLAEDTDAQQEVLLIIRIILIQGTFE